jgi:uncharacterized membrane protein YoaK (UPF0700 family)
VNLRAARFDVLRPESWEEALADARGLRRRDLGKGRPNQRTLPRTGQLALKVGRRRRTLLGPDKGGHECHDSRYGKGSKPSAAEGSLTLGSLHETKLYSPFAARDVNEVFVACGIEFPRTETKVAEQAVAVRRVEKFTVSMSSEQRLSVLAASALATVAGGAMDAWVYLAHGQVFANAQSGNIVLMGVALAGGNVARAAMHLPSLLAFVAGLLASRLSGQLLKHSRLNSRNARLSLECVMLLVLALLAHRMPDRAVIACVGFIAGVQITSLSHIGSWSFNTGMTTGNLRAGVSALAKALTGSPEEWSHAGAMFVLCLAFAVGAAGGAWLTPLLGGATLLPIAALIAAVIAIGPGGLDPIPDWTDLK